MAISRFSPKLYSLVALRLPNRPYWNSYNVLRVSYRYCIFFVNYENFHSISLGEPQAAQSYPVLLITLYLYINSILKIIRKSCVINLLRYIFI